MIGVDTNILVRYITQDDSAQAAVAARIIDSFSADSQGFLSLVVVAELVWVLEVAYRFDKAQLEQVLEKLLRSRELVIERAEVFSQALRTFRANRANFADCLIERCAHAAGCTYTLSFDKRAGTIGMRRPGA
jgi:predicted nucleic-acid-binding protein